MTESELLIMAIHSFGILLGMVLYFKIYSKSKTKGLVQCEPWSPVTRLESKRVLCLIRLMDVAAYG